MEVHGIFQARMLEWIVIYFSRANLPHAFVLCNVSFTCSFSTKKPSVSGMDVDGSNKNESQGGELNTPRRREITLSCVGVLLGRGKVGGKSKSGKAS